MLSYTADRNALESKRRELVAIAYSVLKDPALASQVVTSLCRLTPPQDPPHIIEMITVHSMGASGGRSRKPGNILVNIGGLAADFGDIGLAAAAATVDQRLIPLAALAIWKKIWNRSMVELTAEQASLAYAMWINRDSDDLISQTEAFEMYKLICQCQNLPEPNGDDFNSALSVLMDIGSVEQHSSGDIWLREWVANTYS